MTSFLSFLCLLLLRSGRHAEAFSITTPDAHPCCGYRGRGGVSLQRLCAVIKDDISLMPLKPFVTKKDSNSNVHGPLQTPHSGRHFYPSHPAYRRRKWRTWLPFWRRRGRRFMEGWYYRLTIPQVGSFAFIVSIEDPGSPSSNPLRLACIQVIGPNDTYLVQADTDVDKFWADQQEQRLVSMSLRWDILPIPLLHDGDLISPTIIPFPFH